MWQYLRGRLGAWVLGALFAILIIEMVLMSPKALDQYIREVEAEKVESQADTPVLVMVGINVVETRDQRKEWELWADRALSRQGRGDLELEAAKIRFFGQVGSEFLVTGESGEVEAPSKNMRVRGKVVMESSNGYVFRTDNMEYDSSTRKLTTMAEIFVVGPEEEGGGGRLKLRGQGMSADLSGEEMRILSGVFATKKIPQRQEGLMKISADSSLLSSKDKSIAFSGRVLIEIEGVKVRGPSARFVYDESGQRLKAVEMDGGVRVNDWNKLATSESVKIDLDRNQYLFKGSPSLVQEDDELFGDEILFLNGGKQVKIKNARVKVSRERMEEIN